MDDAKRLEEQRREHLNQIQDDAQALHELAHHPGWKVFTRELAGGTALLLKRMVEEQDPMKLALLSKEYTTLLGIEPRAEKMAEVFRNTANTLKAQPVDPRKFVNR